MRSTMDASVVDLPAPVGPVAITSPRGTLTHRSTTAGKPSSSNEGIRNGMSRKARSLGPHARAAEAHPIKTAPGRLVRSATDAAATRTTGKYYSLPLTAIGLTQPRGSQTMVFDSSARPSKRVSVDCQSRSCQRINRSKREVMLREFRSF